MKPVPQTLFAFLPSKGYPRPKATLHKFLETRECIISKTGTRADAYEFIFECTETGEERRWGCVNLGIGIGN